jgi:tetratricopeptide (TPR) repeat protein
MSRYDEALDAYRKALAGCSNAFQRAHLHALCGAAEDAAHRYPEALAQCDLAEQALGPASDPPEPQWFSSWFDIQDVRMGVAYWRNDMDELARLIERARPLVEAHGSAEQRANFFFGIAQLLMRRDRYLVAEETLQLVRAGYAAAQQAGPTSLWWAGFMVGFTLVWHGDLDEATAILRETLREAERRGEANARSRCLTYLMAAGRKRRDADGVREAIPSVIEGAREASLPEYEAMAIANRAWVAWRSGEEEKAATDAQAALDMWEKLPVRYFYDWMALWPLVAMALASQRIEQAAQYARRMLPPPQQLLQEPVRTMVENAVHAWDAGRPAETEELLRQAVQAAGDLGYL